MELDMIFAVIWTALGGLSFVASNFAKKEKWFRLFVALGGYWVPEQESDSDNDAADGRDADEHDESIIRNLRVCGGRQSCRGCSLHAIKFERDACRDRLDLAAADTIEHLLKRERRRKHDSERSL